MRDISRRDREVGGGGGNVKAYILILYKEPDQKNGNDMEFSLNVSGEYTKFICKFLNF